MGGILIGLLGDYPGVGKDTSAALLAERHGFEVFSFARKLYAEASEAYGIPVEEWQRRDLKEVPQARFALIHCRDEQFRQVAAALLLKESGRCPLEQILRVRLAPRQILRWWGTEFRRVGYGEDYWTRPVFSKILERPNGRHVITDTRLGNELFATVRLGGYIGRILRPSAAPEKLSDHPSEVLARMWPEDFVIHNEGDKDWLAQQWETQVPRLRKRGRAA